MLKFIRLLKERYASVLQNIDQTSHRSNEFSENLKSLILANVFLRKGELNQAEPGHPIQIAVMGPTQAGKSTVVNLLLPAPLAQVSPLAGFTIHPQGFYLGQNDQAINWVDNVIELERLALQELSPVRHDCYALTTLHSESEHVLSNCIIWDTPDFDSIEAGRYYDGVLKTVALADIIVLVVSKDKYADQSVWEMMALLEPLGQATIICLNKIDPDTQTLIVRSFEQKWNNARHSGFLGLVCLPYKKETALVKGFSSEQVEIYKLLTKAISKTKRSEHSRYIGQLINKHWAQWTAPILEEQNCLVDWETLVVDMLDDAMSVYQRDYLDHPYHYETFQRALAELLTLLEIPQLASVFKHARQFVTWPVRQVMKLRNSFGQETKDPVNSSQETTILLQIFEHFCIQISETILTKIDEQPEQEHWWKEIGVCFRHEKSQLSGTFNGAVEKYFTSFQPEIEIHAQRLYNKLRDQPALLNSLRLTRATTDAAAVAVALKTGGIGVHDFILTPAMLSLTSLLTEGALGSHMKKVSADLKKRQYDTVKNQLFVSIIKKCLIKLPLKMNQSDKFNIELETLKSVEKKLTNLRYGLRIF